MSRELIIEVDTCRNFRNFIFPEQFVFLTKRDI